MPALTPAFAQWPKIATALGVGAGGGAVAAFLHVPAPWLLGSLLAVAAAALAGVPVAVPPQARTAVLPLLGVSLASGITPETIAGVGKWPLSLAGLTIALVLASAASSAFLVRFGRWDRATALLASVPGVLSQVFVFAAHTKANMPLITLTHLFRLLMLMAILPLVATLSVDALPGASAAPRSITAPWSCALEIAAGYAAGYALSKIRIAGSWLIGGMLAAATMHLTDITEGQLPLYLVILCHVALGAFVAQRFRSSDFRLLRQAALPSVGAFLVTLAVTGLSAAAVAWVTGQPLALVLVAFAPGALEVMAVLAFALGADPAFVAVHHLARIVALTAILPFAVRRHVE